MRKKVVFANERPLIETLDSPVPVFQISSTWRDCLVLFGAEILSAIHLTCVTFAYVYFRSIDLSDPSIAERESSFALAPLSLDAGYIGRGSVFGWLFFPIALLFSTTAMCLYVSRTIKMSGISTRMLSQYSQLVFAGYSLSLSVMSIPYCFHLSVMMQFKGLLNEVRLAIIIWALSIAVFVVWDRVLARIATSTTVYSIIGVSEQRVFFRLQTVEIAIILLDNADLMQTALEVAPPRQQPFNALIITAVVLCTALTSYYVAQFQSLHRTVQSVVDDFARSNAGHGNVSRFGRWRKFSMMDSMATFATTTHLLQDITFFVLRVKAITLNADVTVVFLAKNSAFLIYFFFAFLRAFVFGQWATMLSELRAWLRASLMFHSIHEAEGLRKESTVGRRASRKSRSSESSRPLLI